MNCPLVSIVMPVYNVEKNLNRCLDSIVNQSYNNLEIILVDDGSTDNSFEICQKYAQDDKRIKALHKENGGVSSARNFGLDHATGDFIYFVDSDDYIDKSLVQIVIDKFNGFDADIIRFNMYVDYGDKNVAQSPGFTESGFVDVNEFHTLLTQNKIYGNPFLQMFKSELIKDNLRFMTDIHMGEDLLFMTEVYCRTNKIYFLNESLYYYFYDEGSASKRIDKGFRNIKEYILLYTRIKEIYIKYNLYSEKLEKDLSSSRFFNICTNLKKTYLYNNYKEAFDFLLNSDVFMEMLHNVDASRFKRGNKILYKLFMNKCKIGLYAFGFVSRVILLIKK